MKSTSLEKFRLNFIRKHIRPIHVTCLNNFFDVGGFLWFACLSDSRLRAWIWPRRKKAWKEEVIPSTSPVRWQWVLQISQLGNLTRKLVITRSLSTFFFRSCGKGPRILSQIIQTVCICWNFVIAQHCPSCCLLVGYTHKQEGTRKERRRRRTSCYNFSESQDHFL